MVSAVSGATAQQKLVLSTLEHAPNGKIGSEILKTAYAKLGLNLETYYTSGKRALVLSSSGVVDGEVLRTSDVAQKYPSLIKVDVPLLTLMNVVFVNRHRSSGEVFMDLKNTRVGFLNGVEQLDAYTQGFHHIWRAESFRELFEMLSLGKLDAVISEKTAGKIEIHALGLDSVVTLDKVIAPETLYHFLHEKHVQLVPKVAEVLQQMKSSGEMEQIANRAVMEIVIQGNK